MKKTIEDMQKIAAKQGGRCLSGVYVNVNHKLLWECSEGHTWKTRPSVILRNFWCPECSGNSKYTIYDAKKLAIQKHGKCLSEEYENNHTKLEWECAHGHQWKAPLSSVRKHWCPGCSNLLPPTLQQIQEYAQSKGGKCLSKEYKNNHTKMTWECKGGHQWEAHWNSVSNLNSWCPICFNIRRNDTQSEEFRRCNIQEMQELALSKNGQCLSIEYVNDYTKLSWQCSKGHIWKAAPTTIKQKHWCPYCRGHHKTIRDMQSLASVRGGKCLSSKYLGNKTKLTWECEQKHTWSTSPDAIIAGCWCPTCNRSKNITENKCREIVEYLTGQKFPSTRSVLPGQYELDMFNEDLRLAFEYDGEQHFIFNPYWHKTQDGFRKQQKRDQNKNDLCKQEDIALERIHYKIAKDDTVLESFIREKLIKHNVPLKGEI